jgi:sulfate permease, SulP family
MKTPTARPAILGAAAPAAWPILRGFAGWRPADLGADLIAGFTLAAIAIPEQMATARLGGFEPQIGFIALIAGAVGFALFGASRLLSIGADSTITPIFAGTLATVAAVGSPQYAEAAATLALMVGAIVLVGGLFRLGWIADLLSVPVTTGFLAGIAGHIILSQAPAVLGLPPPSGSTLDKVVALAEGVGRSNLLTLALAFGVLAVTTIGERVNPRIPAALIALVVATALTTAFGLSARGVGTIGEVAAATSAVKWPDIEPGDVLKLAPLALIVALVVMVQTAATTRAFVRDRSRGPDVNRDFIGAGAASLLAGLFGAFPLNASPPRTAVVSETGGRSQGAALTAAAIVLALAAFGEGLLAGVPFAALAGVLLFVAGRIVRLSTFVAVWRQSRAEFALIVATLVAILVFPIEQGVALGIVLSLLHGVWTTTRSPPVEFVRLPGVTVWWPKDQVAAGETEPEAIVVGFQAPLSFLNAYDFDRVLRRLVGGRPAAKALVVEAANLVDIDYTAAQVLSGAIDHFRKQGLDVAFARLESTRAQEAFRRFGLDNLIGADRLFHSVEEAVRALARSVRTPPAA